MGNKRSVISLRVTALETYVGFFGHQTHSIWRLAFETFFVPSIDFAADYIESSNRNAMGERGRFMSRRPPTATTAVYTIIKSQSRSFRPSRESMFARNQIPRYGDGNCDGKTNFVLSVMWWRRAYAMYVTRKMHARLFGKIIVAWKSRGKPNTVDNICCYHLGFSLRMCGALRECIN